MSFLIKNFRNWKIQIRFVTYRRLLDIGQAYVKYTITVKITRGKVVRVSIRQIQSSKFSNDGWSRWSEQRQVSTAQRDGGRCQYERELSINTDSNAVARGSVSYYDFVISMTIKLDPLHDHQNRWIEDLLHGIVRQRVQINGDRLEFIDRGRLNWDDELVRRKVIRSRLH